MFLRRPQPKPLAVDGADAAVTNDGASLSQHFGKRLSEAG